MTLNHDDELHIASLVVHAVPRRAAQIAEALSAPPEAEVHAVGANGKLVVTLEAASAEAITQRVAAIQRLDGVLAATLVYQCADSLAAMNEELNDAQA